jgi:hypothetical protein
VRLQSQKLSPLDQAAAADPDPAKAVEQMRQRRLLEAANQRRIAELVKGGYKRRRTKKRKSNKRKNTKRKATRRMSKKRRKTKRKNTRRRRR